MNPVAVICTRDRFEITCKNVNSLLGQGCHVVLMVHDSAEKKQYREEYWLTTGLTIGTQENSLPLGANWQLGVELAMTLNPDPLIITGSDDILSSCFVEAAIEKLEDYDFIGLRQWYIYDPASDTAYLFNYKAVGDLPLGGGRVYSKRMLEKLDYKLFDTGLQRLLDNSGWNGVQSSGLPWLLVKTQAAHNMGILAVKGDWDTMNPIDKTFGHPNVELVQTITNPKDLLTEVFGYEK